MKPDPKPEKREGQKRYTCKMCNEKFWMDKIKYSRNSLTPLNGVCESYECKSKALVKRVVVPLRKEKAKKKRDKNKKDQEELYTRADWKKKLQKKINWIVKKLDKEYPCIASPGEATLRFDAGHFYSVKSCGSLRFWMHNIHKQGSQSNGIKGGEPLKFREGLILRYGLKYFNFVEEGKLIYRDKDLEFTKENLKIWYKNSLSVCKRINAGERLTRHQVDEAIGIYTDTKYAE